jgi:hypothetical protein
MGSLANVARLFVVGSLPHVAACAARPNMVLGPHDPLLLCTVFVDVNGMAPDISGIKSGLQTLTLDIQLQKPMVKNTSAHRCRRQAPVMFEEQLHIVRALLYTQQ